MHVTYVPCGNSNAPTVGILELLGHRVEVWHQPAAALLGRPAQSPIVVDGTVAPTVAQRFCLELARLTLVAPVVALVTDDWLPEISIRWRISDFLLPHSSPAEIEARLLRITARASAGRDDSFRRYGPLVLDAARLSLSDETGTSVALTRTEHSLLRAFFDNPDVVLSREKLLEEAWAGDGFSSRNIDTYVCRLRRKLGAHGGSIQTVRSMGYRLVTAASTAPVESRAA
jgi:DNA-binding winged helix-turn-helix (wHTH) protein